MFEFLKAKPNKHEQEVLDRIAHAKNMGYKSMRVVGRGTMTVDAQDVMNSDEFKSRAKKAHDIVKRAS